MPDFERLRREGRGRTFDNYSDFHVIFNLRAAQAPAAAWVNNTALKAFAETALADVFSRHGKGRVSMPQASASRVLIEGIDGQIAREIEALPSVESVWPDAECSL